MCMTERKIERLQAGLTQMGLAIRARVTPSQLSYFENGILVPKPEVARRLNLALGKRVYPEGPETRGGNRE